jgi:prophage DNA circulation protein
MTATRDWSQTLRPASYKGVGFFVQSDVEKGGRGLVIHKFPNRDDPYVEDLGEEPRFYEGTVYLHGDSVDTLAAQFIAVLSARGAGTLVLPVRDPVRVQVQSFERKFELDHLGYIAFDVKFVRDGAAGALISLGTLLNGAMGAADALAAALAAAFPRALTVFAQPDHVVAAATEGLASAAAAIDAQRLSYPVDPLQSAALRDRIGDLVDASANAVTEVAPAGTDAVAAATALIAITRALGEAMPPASAARAMLELADMWTVVAAAPSYLAPSARRADFNAAAVARLARLAALTAYAEAVMNASYPDRPAGVTARANVAARFAAELDDAQGADNAALFVAIEDLSGQVCAYLSRLINDLAPVITVGAALPLPSIWWAYRLYADPSRAAELVARNGVRHPSFMPLELQVLSR